MKAKEIWKDIPNYEGHYQASTLGRIRGIERYINHPRGGKRYQKETIKPFNADPHGYGLVRLVINKVGKTYRTHRLIMLTFKGESKMPVDHINNIPNDNRLCNLEYVTYKENAHRYRRIVNNGRPIGVVKCGKKYRSSATINGKKINIGSFNTEKQAESAIRNVLSGDVPKDYYLHKYNNKEKNIHYRSDTKKYSVRITVNGKYKNFGCSKTLEGARQIRIEAKKIIKKLK